MQLVELYNLHNFLHYVLFYFSLFLSFVLLAWLLTQKNPLSLLQTFLPFSLLIILPPIFDLILTKGAGKNITYFLLPLTELFKNFYTFGFLSAGITSGLQITSALIIVLLSAYVFKKTNSFFRTATCIFLSYTLIFSYAALPDLFLRLAFPSPTLFLTEVFQRGLATSFYFDRSGDSLSILTEKFAATLFWLTTLAQTALLFYLSTKTSFSAWKKNLQWNRAFYWFFIALLGFKLARPENIFQLPPNLFDVLTIGLFLVVSLCGVWLAIIINDSNDEHIDRVANQARPLVSGTITKQDYRTIGASLLLFFLTGLFLLSAATAFLLLLGELLYFFYSSPPFRLKRHFLTSSLITGLAGLTVAMAGFFLFNQSQRLQDFPAYFALVIPIVLAFFSNIKDLKDYTGDLAANIKTIPVVFGQKKGALFIGLSFAVIFSATPFLIQKYFLFLPMLLLGISIYFAILRKPFEEKYVFPFIYSYFLLVFLFI